MKKTITLLVSMALTLLAAASVSAHHEYGYKTSVQQTYDNYFESRDYLRDNSYRDFIRRNHYNPRMAYMPVMAYRGPLFKTYGDNRRQYLPPGKYQTTGKHTPNPFYGHTYERTYHCHGPGACHYHNVFPNSN